MDNRRASHGQTQSIANPIGTNDFDYEDKLKTEESTMVYEGLHFNLAAENSKETLIKLSVLHITQYVLLPGRIKDKYSVLSFKKQNKTFFSPLKV